LAELHRDAMEASRRLPSFLALFFCNVSTPERWNIGGFRALGSAVTTHTVIPSEVENGASRTSDMDGCAARVTARVSDDERVKPLDASLMRSKTVNTIWFLVCVY